MLKTEAERKRKSRSLNPEAHKNLMNAWIEKNRDRINEKRRERYRRSPDAHQKSSFNWYHKHRERILAQKSAYRDAHKNEFNKRQRDRNAADPTLNRYFAKLRIAAKKKAVPPWFSEIDDLVWREAQSLTRIRLDATGIKWEADHMIPIKAKTASGLHVWNNCQVIPAQLNAMKKNKLIFIDRNEWINHI